MSSDEEERRSPELDLPTDFYESSESEEEDWGDAADVDHAFKIVGEEVANNDEVHYEVKWPDWKRSDGTQNTWHRKGDVDSPVHGRTSNWDTIMRKKRKQLKVESLSIVPWANTDVLNSNTRYRAQAYDEKLKERMSAKVEHAKHMREALERNASIPGVSEYLPPEPEGRSSISRTRAGTSRSQSISGNSTISSGSGSRASSRIPPADNRPSKRPSLPKLTSVPSRINNNLLPPSSARSAGRPPPSPSSSSHSAFSFGSSMTTPSVTSISSVATSPPHSSASLPSLSSKILPADVRSLKRPSLSGSATSISGRNTKFLKPAPKQSSTMSSDSSLFSSLKSNNLVPSSSTPSAAKPPSSTSSISTPAFSFRSSMTTLSGSSVTTVANSPPSSSTPFQFRSRRPPASFVSSQSSIVTAAEPQSPFSSTPGTLQRATTPPTTPSVSNSMSTSTRQMRPLPGRQAKAKDKGKGKAKEGSQRSRIERLSEEWTTAARRAGAAAIEFVNDVDGEDGPPLDDDFDYLENSRSNEISQPEPGVLLTCDCETHDSETAADTCKTASNCGCQDVSEWRDENGKPGRAYTDNGLFAFNLPMGEEVIECNKYCSCHPDTCANSIAQRPRVVSIEVFKTLDRGWGARPTIKVREGMVLGIYTGEILHRTVAEQAQDRTYLFDLDGRDLPEFDGDSAMYSIDAAKCGNWTRFINHSCLPNLAVYNAVWNTVPEANTPNLVFYAVDDIPAGSELTVDYRPGEPIPAKGKKRKKRPRNTSVCTCGAERCRGWV